MQTINIVTHNGTFHTDEVVAYSFLNYLYPDNSLTRTRDSKIIEKADIVIDVGQLYDADKKRFDHHQSGFNQTFNDKTTIMLSSAGLIYKHYGAQLIEKFCLENQLEKIPSTFDDLYFRFIIEIDAHDNGIRQYSENFYEMLNKQEIQQKFYTNLSLGQLISKLNTSDISDDHQQIIAFKTASQIAWQFFSITLKNYLISSNAVNNDYKIIQSAFEKRLEHHQSGHILVVGQDCNTWRKCLAMYESDHSNETKVKFIIYPNNNKSWNIRAISDQLFKNRLDLLPFDEMKKKVDQPEDVTFVHNKLFIGAALTLQTAIQMGVVSLIEN